eukprot:158254-Pyramimonas_sp.AAC.1
MAQLYVGPPADRSWGHLQEDGGVQHARTKSICIPLPTTGTLNTVGCTIMEDCHWECPSCKKYGGQGKPGHVLAPGKC